MQETDLTSDYNCIVCAGATTRIKMADREAMASALERALEYNGALEVMPPQSAVHRCKRCGLEFAVPMREPGVEFYEWLTKAGFPYPENRWEWSACHTLLQRKAASSSKESMLLDIGSGDGAFLATINGIPNLRSLGVDHNPDAVNAARARGLDVILGGLAEAKEQLTEGVDIITLWHVLEHVGDPVELLLKTKDLLRHDGEIYLSVPLSPMSYESASLDPFNLPPHHLTRWNLPSLQMLADRLCLKMDLVLPSAESLPHRVLRSLMLQAMPPFGISSRRRKILKLGAFVIAKPWRLPIEIWRQWKRPRLSGHVLPDVVLVKFEKATHTNQDSV